MMAGTNKSGAGADTGVGVDAGVGAGRDGRFFGFLLVAAFTTADATATVTAGSMDGSCMVLFLTRHGRNRLPVCVCRMRATY